MESFINIVMLILFVLFMIFILSGYHRTKYEQREEELSKTNDTKEDS